MKKILFLSVVSTLVITNIVNAKPVFFECQASRLIYSSSSYKSSSKFEAVIDIEKETCMIDSKSGYLVGGYPSVSCKHKVEYDGNKLLSKFKRYGETIEINRKSLSFSYWEWGFRNRDSGSYRGDCKIINSGLKF